MISVTFGKVETYCYMVKRGKSAAMIPIKNSQLNGLKNIIETRFELKTYVEDLVDGEWTTLWIYKKDYILDIIKSLPEQPKTVFDHWVLGKLFGYSDEAIEEFIRAKL